MAQSLNIPIQNCARTFLKIDGMKPWQQQGFVKNTGNTYLLFKYKISEYITASAGTSLDLSKLQQVIFMEFCVFSVTSFSVGIAMVCFGPLCPTRFSALGGSLFFYWIELKTKTNPNGHRSGGRLGSFWFSTRPSADTGTDYNQDFDCGTNGGAAPRFVP